MYDMYVLQPADLLGGVPARDPDRDTTERNGASLTASERSEEITR